MNFAEAPLAQELIYLLYEFFILTAVALKKFDAYHLHSVLYFNYIFLCLKHFKITAGIDSKELTPPGDDEVKDNQWLGVTVRSQGPGGRVLVCFPLII